MRIIAGLFKGRTLISPKSAARPSSELLRGALFNIIQEIEGLTLLDLFAGSGAIGFEALSRGAAQVTFVDNDPLSLKTLRQNAALLGVESKIAIIKGEAAKVLPRLPSFDLIFLDPPYALDTKEFIEASIPHIKPGGALFVENAFRVPLKENSLLLVSTRRFGDSRLSHYTLHEG